MPKERVFDEHLTEYENWFLVNEWVYRSELKALEKVMPKTGRGVEIGIGSGLFAEPLGIREGVDPSAKMRGKATERGLQAIDGVAEELPYPDESFDFALMVTTICFVDDIVRTFLEAGRILKNGGRLVLGFVDKDSSIGRMYLEHKEESVFYRDALFFGTQEVCGILRDTGFGVGGIWQTVFGRLDEVRNVQEPKPGFGEGSFVALEGIKE
ncbi:MAG: class I SAM-dependent methyltransferase [Candidatus Syntrophosphaera sp.]